MAQSGENEQKSPVDSADTVSQNEVGGDQAGGFLKTSTVIITEPHKGNPTKLARELKVQGLPVLRFLIPKSARAIVANSLECLVDRRSRTRAYCDGVELTATLSDDLDEDTATTAGSAAVASTPIASQTPESAIVALHLREQQALLDQYKLMVTEQRRQFELNRLALAQQNTALANLNTDVDTARARLKATLHDHDQILKTDLKDTIEIRNDNRAALREAMRNYHEDEKQVGLRQKEQMEVIKTFHGATADLQKVVLDLLKRAPSSMEDKLKAAKELLETLLKSSVGEAATEVLATTMAMMAARVGAAVSPEQVVDSFLRNGAEYRERSVRLRMMANLQKSDASSSLLVAVDYLEGQLPDDVVMHHLQSRSRVTVTQTG